MKILYALLFLSYPIIGAQKDDAPQFTDKNGKVFRPTYQIVPPSVERERLTASLIRKEDPQTTTALLRKRYRNVTVIPAQEIIESDGSRHVIHREIHEFSESPFGPFILEKNDDGSYKTLHDAALADDVQAIETLIKAGSNPNALDKFGDPALSYAIAACKFQAARALCQLGANLDTPGTNGVCPKDLFDESYRSAANYKVREKLEHIIREHK